MFQFIESICCVNKELRNLEYHQARFDRTRSDNFNDSTPILLQEIIQFPSDLTDEKYKVRIVYDREILSIEFQPYQIKPISTIKLFTIENKIEYTYKYLDRWFFDEYLKEAQTDDLVLVKSNYITDCIYSNIIFFDGENWFTPRSILLKGTMRESLLNDGKIKEKNIKVSDLVNYQSFKRINAMMNFDESQEISILQLF
ncbi:4-amino-4-deoxychorismate lyase [Algoriella xinjiangensis]|uniref:4-amino-4-deoxychorismate lyase n=1 Tax=Algoriella xinjiangensis TaxID=684065 RepID=A0A1I5ARJ9_9FLAO|nr:aminotransferase class IV [Algoriella xinjiangensis]SFN65071.1 4-amino-4-deoxychorismate lyase [Algoriella xinjiangensis]VDH17011.1 Branched-chain amino acid aminotransferase/4-amino-4-deoxychorismate lyase [Algoriella xinjiangensis]